MRRILRWTIRLLPFIYMVFIWYLSSHPSDAIIYFRPRHPAVPALAIPSIVIPNVTSIPDPVLKERLHFIEFAVLYVLWVLAFLTTKQFTIKQNTIAALLAITYGLIDELHQIFVPSRSATVVDFLKDLTGVTVVYLVVHLCFFVYKRSVPGRLIRGCADVLRAR